MDCEDAVVLTLSIPDELREVFAYREGQHLPVRAEIDGQEVRRTYSVCASVAENELRLGIRVQAGGVFSNYASDRLVVGDIIHAMPPAGRFRTSLCKEQSKSYAAFVAGSGITPVLSIIRTILETESLSEIQLFYGNRKRSTTMFVNELYDLKNRFPDRLALHFIMSREATDIDLYSGRLDRTSVQNLHDAFLKDCVPDEFFICGPNPMIDEISSTLVDLGFAKDRIHTERYRVGDVRAPRENRQAAESVATDEQEIADVSVITDGHRQKFKMYEGELNIVDAAARQSIELPFSCKSGVCSTCRCKLVAGEVVMAQNYALEQWELDSGFILPCQSIPVTEKVTLDYDQV